MKLTKRKDPGTEQRQGPASRISRRKRWVWLGLGLSPLLALVALSACKESRHEDVSGAAMASGEIPDGEIPDGEDQPLIENDPGFGRERERLFYGCPYEPTFKAVPTKLDSTKANLFEKATGRTVALFMRLALPIELPNPTATDPATNLTIVMRDSDPIFAGRGITTGTFTLSGEKTPRVELNIYFPNPHGQAQDRIFAATKGTITITSLKDRFVATLRGVTFAEARRVGAIKPDPTCGTVLDDLTIDVPLRVSKLDSRQ